MDVQGELMKLGTKFLFQDFQIRHGAPVGNVDLFPCLNGLVVIRPPPRVRWGFVAFARRPLNHGDSGNGQEQVVMP